MRVEVLSLAGLAVVAGLSLPAKAASPKPMPVYPGSQLEGLDDAENRCCDFATRDPFQKVVAFYEKALVTKALDAKALALKLPAQRRQVEQVMEQLPPGAKLAAFPLGPAGPGGAVELFEVAAFSGVVHFSIPEEWLAGADARFVTEWGQRAAPARTQTAARERTERERGRETAAGEAEEARRMATIASTFERILKKLGLDVLPGARPALDGYGRTGGDGSPATGMLLRYATPIGFDKVVAFYAGKIRFERFDQERPDPPQELYLSRQAEGPGPRGTWVRVEENRTWNGKAYGAPFVELSLVVQEGAPGYRELAELDREPAR